jgi:hypothetical protein
MSYSLSFSDDFYSSHDEYETGELQLNGKGQPVTLRSAICLLLATPSSERRRLCLAFRCSVANLDPDTIMDRAREIDSCASIGRNGVPVYLTRGDWALTVTVYEQDRPSNFEMWRNQYVSAQ